MDPPTRKGEDLLLSGPCVALPVLNALVTEQVLPLRGHHLLPWSSLRKGTPAARSPQPQHLHQGNSPRKSYLALTSSASEARRNFKLGSSTAHFGGFATSARCLSLGLRACQITLQLYIGPIIEGKRAHCLQKPSTAVAGQQLTSAGLRRFGNRPFNSRKKKC